MFSILLDNSAIRRLAIRDPAAEFSNKAIKKGSLLPVLSHHALGEIIDGLVDRPFDSELCGRCQYLLSLDNLAFGRDVDDGVRIEYQYESHLVFDEQDETKRLKSLELLRQCSIGAVPPHLKDLSKENRKLNRQRIEAFIEDIHSGRDFSEFASKPIETFATQDLVYEVAKDVLNLHFAAQGAFPMPDALDRVARGAAYSPRAFPFLAATTRLQIWSNWYVAQHGKIPTDLYGDIPFLASALCSDSVLTADRRLQKVGPILFPEVRFLDAVKFVERLERWAE